MAVPRLFVSSTCYDLNEVRDNMYSFIQEMGYTPVFSDKNDIFYHPDLHTHEACIKEIESCDIFILVIGGRFGGNYVYDMEKSIVNAEYEAAKNLKIPIITFIKRDVHDQHHLFNKNKFDNPKSYQNFTYTSIDKQETASKIFSFIDEVRKAEYNNGYFTFEYSREIKDILKKQLAGMFHDFLWNRMKEQEDVKTNRMLVNLTTIGKKTEEIMDLIYRKVDVDKAEETIARLELEKSARKFWNRLNRLLNTGLSHLSDEELVKWGNVKANENWYDFIVRVGKSEIKEFAFTEERVIKGLYHPTTKKFIALEAIKGELNKIDENNVKRMNEYFKAYKNLSKENRIEVLNDLE
jgi:hypothetical protein